MIAPDEATAVHPTSRADWRVWLDEHGETATDAWVIIHKQASPHPGVQIRAAMSEALCFGWIDSLARRRDEHTFFLRFTPRRPTSRWSRRNADDVTELIRTGLMTARGLALVEQAKARGTWPT